MVASQPASDPNRRGKTFYLLGQGQKGRKTFVLIDQGEVEKMGVLWDTINPEMLHCRHPCILSISLVKNLMV